MHAPDTTLNRRRALRAALVGFLGAILAAACAAPHASAAAQRYASPNGAGTACSSVSSCAIKHAADLVS